MGDFTKVHKDLDMKINDYKHQSMCYAESCVNRSSKSEQDKSKKNIRESMKENMLEKYGGLLTRIKTG